jgi:hypothetical protein
LLVTPIIIVTLIVVSNTHYISNTHYVSKTHCVSNTHYVSNAYYVSSTHYEKTVLTVQEEKELPFKRYFTARNVRRLNEVTVKTERGFGT